MIEKLHIDFQEIISAIYRDLRSQGKGWEKMHIELNAKGNVFSAQCWEIPPKKDQE